MKSEYVIAAFKSFISGNREEAMRGLEMIVANEKRAGNHKLAGQFARLLEAAPRQMLRLPDAPPEIGFFAPSRHLSDMILAPTVRASIDGIVREWLGRDILAAHNLRPRSTILLKGPSGNGKTALAKSLASAVSLPFGVARYESIINSHLGETGAKIAKILGYATATPCVLFFDEADSIAHQRGGETNGGSKESNRIVNQLLIGLDKVAGRSMVVFATNFSKVLDPALHRRFDAVLELGPPDELQTVALVDLLRARWPIIGDWNFSGKASSFAAVEAAAMDRARRLVLDIPVKQRGRWQGEESVIPPSHPRPA